MYRNPRSQFTTPLLQLSRWVSIMKHCAPSDRRVAVTFGAKEGGPLLVVLREI